MTEEFSPTNRMIRLGGRRGGDAAYLPVRQRMIWFRTLHPDGDINTEMVEHVFGEYAIFKATVSWPIEREGSPENPWYGLTVNCSGYGSETAPDFRDYIEKAETKAIGRALAAAGFGTEAAFEEDPSRPADSPYVRPTATIAGNASRNQVTQIQDLTNVLGLEIRGYLNGEYGVTDPENLTLGQATTVIDKLRSQVRERSAVTAG
jgi:hypothetical protein